MTSLHGVGTIALSRLASGELRASLGIDLSSAAPRDELVHPQVNADGSVTLPAQVALRLFGFPEELGIRLVEGVTVFHDHEAGLPLECRLFEVEHVAR